VSALGKLVVTQKAGAELEKLYFSKLPLMLDEEEASAVHLLFIKQALAQNPVFANHQ